MRYRANGRLMTSLSTLKTLSCACTGSVEPSSWPRSLGSGTLMSSVSIVTSLRCKLPSAAFSAQLSARNSFENAAPSSPAKSIPVRMLINRGHGSVPQRINTTSLLPAVARAVDSASTATTCALVWRQCAIAAFLMIALLGAMKGKHAQAQGPVLSHRLPDHEAGLGLGWDQTWELEAGYAHAFRELLFAHDVQVFGLVGLPVAQFGRFAGGRLEAGLRALVPVGKGLAVAGLLGGGVVLADDPTGTKLGLSTRISASPGYYADNWAVALDLGWEGALASYMAQSERVQALFGDRYPDATRRGAGGPADGLYGLTASRFRVGLSGGYVAAAAVGTSLEAGFEYCPQVEGVIGNASIGGMPFYLLLAGDYRW